MKTSTSRWNRTKTASRNDRASRARRRALFNYEPLEQRALLTAFVINGDQSGANVDDIITIDLHGEWGSYSVNGVDGTFLPGAIDQVIVNPGGGHNIINILNTEVEAPVTVNPGGGLDEVNVGNSVDGVQGIHGAVNIGDLGSGQTVLFVDNSVDSENQTVDFYDGQITGIAPAPINFSTNPNTDVPGMGELGIYVDGASGNSTFNIHDTSVLGRNGGTLLQTGGGEDTVNVLGTTGYLTVRNQGGLDTTTIGAAGSLGAIKGQVWVGGGDGPTAVTNLSLDDSADPAASAIEMYSDHVTGIAPATIGWTPRMDPFTGGVYSLNVSCGNGGNTINVHDTSGRGQDGASYVYNRNRISTGTGNDTVNIQGTTGHLIVFNPGGHDTTTIGAGGSLANIHSGVIVNSDTANGADVALTIGNTSDTASTMFEVGIGHSPDNPQAAGYVVLDDSVPISWDVFGSPLGVTSLNLKTGVKSDYLRITGTSVPLSVYNAGGEDVVYIGTGSMTSIGTGSMTSITAPINLQGEGDTLLYLDDRADPTASTIDLYNGSITGIAPAAITWTPKSNSTGGVTNIFVYGGSGDNTYFVHDTGDFNNYANSFFGSGRTELDTGPGNDRVNVLGTTGSLFVNNTGGQDQVGVGGIWAGGSMANIKGNVYVYGVGDTALSLDDSSDTTPSTIDFYNDPSAYWGWVTGLAPGRIQWSATSASTGGVTYLGVQAGSGGDTINVHDTSAFLNGMDLKPGSNASVNILGTNGKLNVIDDSFNDTIVVGNTAQGHFDPGQGTLRAINGPISISGAGSTSLAIDGNDATARTATLTSSSLVGLAPGSITFGSAVNALSIWCGANVGFTVSSMPAIPLSVVSGPNSTLIAPDTSNYWSFDSGNFSINAGSFGHLSFGGFDKLVGGMEDDHFYFQDPNMSIVQVSIDGGGGANTLSYNQAKYGSVFVNLANSTATSILGTVTDIQNFTGGNTPGLFFGPDGGSTFNITGTNMGNVAGVSFTGFGTLFGGTGNDVFVLRNGASVTGFVQGQGGTNTLDLSAYTTPTSVNLAASQATGVGGTFANIQTVIGGTNAANTLFGPTAATTYSITGQNTGIVNGLSFSHFGNITAGPGNDRFVFSDAATLSGALSGGAGSNTIDESAYSTTVAANLSAKTITGVGTNYSSIQTFIAGTNAGGTLTGPATSSNYYVTGLNAVTVAGLTYNNFSSLTGGAGNDLFLFSPGASLGGSINGGLGNNSINESDYITPVALNLAAGTITGLGSPYANIRTITGGSGANTLIGPDASSTYRITGPNVGNVGTFNFANFGSLTAGSANDVFKFTSAGTITGNIDGGGGSNTIDETLLTTPVTLNVSASTVSQLTGTFTNIQTVLAGGNSANQILGPSTDSTFNITGTNAGNIAGLSFSGFGNLTGGTGNDTFTFGPAATLLGNLDGGTGINTLDYSSLSTVVTLNLVNGTASDIRGTFANIQNVNGGTNTTNLLTGPATGSTYQIVGRNTGSVNGFVFRGFGSIVAGAGDDATVFSDGALLTGSLNLGLGANTLDESAYTTGITVNLATGRATGVGGTISNIQYVRGGSGNDVLTGNSVGDVLIGGAGNDTLIGGSGRSLLIGGTGVDNVTGGSGDDIIIGGSTSFDNNNDALKSILAEWQSADSYAARLNFLKNGGGLNGTNVLILGTTVVNDSGTNVLIGGGGNDWLLTFPPTVSTQGALSVTASGATLTGVVNPNGYPRNVSFQYSTDPTFAPTVQMAFPAVTYNGPSSATDDVAVDAAGNVYVTDYKNNRVRELLTDGTIRTIGTGFVHPTGVAVDAAGNVYVADYSVNGDVKEVMAGSGKIVTLASGIYNLTRIAVDGMGNVFVVASNGGVVLEIIAGTSTIKTIGFAHPNDVAVDAAGNIFVADPVNRAVYERMAGTSIDKPIGSGFLEPYGVAVDSAGNVFVGDVGRNALFEVMAGTGTIITLSTGGYPASIAVNGVGDVFVLGDDDGASYELSPPTVSAAPASVSGSTDTAISATLYGLAPATTYYYRAVIGGFATGSTFSFTTLAPPTVTTTAADSVTTSGANLNGTVNANGGMSNVVFQYSTSPTLSPTVQSAVPGALYGQDSVAVDGAGNVFVLGFHNTIDEIMAGTGIIKTIQPTASLGDANSIAVDGAGNVFVADYTNNAVREVMAGTGITKTIAQVYQPWAVAADAAGHVYVTSQHGRTTGDWDIYGLVYEIDANTGSYVGGASGFISPRGIAVDAAGNLYVPDEGNRAVYEVMAGTKTKVTIASAINAQGVAVDGLGNVFISDGQTVREIIAGTGTVVPIGSGFSNPQGLAVDAAGNVFVANYIGNSGVVEVSIPTIAATPGTVSGVADTTVSAALSGLTPGTTYYYRAIASGGVMGGDAVGSIQSFTTAASGGSPGNGDGPPPPTVNVASARFEPGTADARSIPTIAKIGSEPTVAVSNNNAAVHDEAIESMFAVGVQDDSDSFLFRRSGGRSSGLSLRKA